MGKTIRDILEELRREATDEVEKGRKFEQLMLAFLRNDRQYSKLFDAVWLWADYPNRGNRPDTGIDLVARERATGEMVAIQCKFYAPETVISKPAVDSFLATSSKSEFGGRLFITTSDYWGKNAKDALINQSPPVSIMSVADLDESSIDWSKLSISSLSKLSVEPIKQPRQHQKSAILDCLTGFNASDRGRLIMACGTGKTFTSLRLTEKMLPDGGLVLFLVPSISLLSQAVKEWSINAEAEITSFAVCSDTSVGKRKNSEDLPVSDLAFPATTNSKEFLEKFTNSKKIPASLQVVFSTYQSIAVISEAQSLGLPNFDLIVCDEAHRTTGVTASGTESTTFLKVHDNDFISGSKRLYMTATPKVFSEAAAKKAEEADAVIADMNNESLFGPEFHRLGFGEAVERDILTDYKVLVLAVDEQYIAEKFQQELASEDGQLNLEDTAKIVGCWNGLSKRALNQTDFFSDPEPMKRAVAFARSIAESKSVTAMFQQVVDKEMSLRPDGANLRCEIQHVDGTFSSFNRNEKLDWLKQEPAPGTARILSNARCLTEGVDVPALDAIMFLKPRESQIDVVQAVGRVMRKLDGKKYGYVILPIAIPSGIDPETALADNKKYRTVWQVLQALRSHDERFDAMVHRIDLTGQSPQIEIIGVGAGESEVSVNWNESGLSFPNFDNWKEAILAKIVERVGERKYWEHWATDIASIARRQISRIESLVKSDSEKEAEFKRFLKGLQDNLHPSIEAHDAVEMLAQHQITKPIFDALFGDYAFTKLNPVSIVMDSMLAALADDRLSSETAELDAFYKSVEMRVGGLTDDSARQHVIKQLYEQFFKTAFPDTAERLGIVYTPNEIVDFIIASIEKILVTEFNSSISDPKVHLLDPFTGTGTFIVRLLQSNLLSETSITEKYKSGLHANELVLLAYYIAAINIESTYHSQTGQEYEPFGGLVLTDSFQLHEAGDEIDRQGVFRNNNSRAEAQRALDIRVVFGNPPYSKGQESINDDNKNLSYPSLDQRIAETFVQRSKARAKNALYDSYIRSMRWAADRIGESGIVAFVSNGSFIDGSSLDGTRQALLEEFDKLYVLNLRGNQRTAGEESRREGGKIFGSGSRSTVTIYFLIKSKAAKQGLGELHYCEIGDYLSREEKLEKVSVWADVSNVPWVRISPDANGDWINQRDEHYSSFISIGSRTENEARVVFRNFTLGVTTGRDA
jgi:predicted helicase